jgi:uncharacterized protein
LRFVFDTNVVVSAVLFAGSAPRQAFDAAVNKGQLLISLPTLTELHDVLHRQLDPFRGIRILTPGGLLAEI